MSKKVRKVSDKTAAMAKLLLKTADGLVSKREEWQNNEYARSNTRLYEILAAVLQMYEQVKDDKALRIEAVKRMKESLAASGVRIQTNTLALTLFVRYVFRTDRQRALNYSRTLQAAIVNNVRAEDFAEFVENAGGVEQCKRAFTKSEKVLAKEKAITDAWSLVEEQLEAAVDSPLAQFKVPTSFVRDFSDDYMFVIARTDTSGNVKALSAIPAQSAGMTKWAKQKLALFLSAQSVEAEKNAKQKRSEAAIGKAIRASKNKTPTVTETVGELLNA